MSVRVQLRKISSDDGRLLLRMVRYAERFLAQLSTCVACPDGVVFGTRPTATTGHERWQ